MAIKVLHNGFTFNIFPPKRENEVIVEEAKKTGISPTLRKLLKKQLPYGQDK